MRALVLLTLVAVAVSALDPYFVEKKLNETVEYFLSAQQPCGAFFDCTPNYWRRDAFIAYFLYPEHPLVFESSVRFVEYVYLDYYSLWNILNPSTTIYTWWPLFDVLAILSAGKSTDLVVAVENIIDKNFDEYGLKTSPSRNYQNYFGKIPYDLMSTSLALLIAKKSEVVDGNLAFAKFNSTLHEEFWRYVLSYIRGEISAPLATDYVRALLALLSLGFEWMRGPVCKALDESYFQQIYESYLDMEPVSLSSPALEVLGEEALICASLGYLDGSYALKVVDWALQSYAINNAGAWPSSEFAVSLYTTLLGGQSKAFALVSVDQLPGTQDSSAELLVITQPPQTVTKYMPVTMYTTKADNTISVVGLPGVPLLAPFFFKRMRKKN
ncbi:MAG: hypothetical protein GXO07_05280 [Crenarchaeota archaeon]|nr:hypothetical protein [Thermoproteota archaeon]